MLITASHCSSFMRTITLSRVMPALLTRMFSAPHSLTTSSTDFADAVALGHVAGDRLGRAAGGADGGHGVGQALGIDVDAGHFGPRRRQRLGDAAAQSARGPGH